MRSKIGLLFMVVLSFVLSGCSSSANDQISEIFQVGSESVAAEELSSDGAPSLANTAQPEPESITVTYHTPSQAEGPYYTVEKPADRDNDLIVVDGATGEPDGEIIEFFGVVYDSTGFPVSDVLIEIWQTDSQGVYLHPADSGTDLRDPNFQFYGEATTADDGSYEFRTILPGRYEPRPRHIHVKIKFEGQTLLTTQFYFAGDSDLDDEAMFTQIGTEGEHLLIVLTEYDGDVADTDWIGERDIVLNANFSDE